MLSPPPSKTHPGNNRQFSRRTEKHYYWIDLIRFLAAFLVMAGHFRGAFFEEYSVLPGSQQNPLVFIFYFVTRLGYEAVVVFFVLSGFLVGGKAMERIRANSFKAKDYAIDRFARIMLPLISALLFYLPICLWFNGSINVVNWIGCLVGMQGVITGIPFGPLWSLSYEMWFYVMMFGIAVLFVSKTQKKIAFAVTVLLLSMMVFVKLDVYYLWIWFTGAIVYFVKTDGLKHRKLIVVTCLALIGILIVSLQLMSGTRAINVNINMDLDMYRKIMSIILGMVVALFIKIIIDFVPKSKFSLSINRLGTKLAAFSYTIYLTHYPVMRLLENLGAPKCESINFVSVSLYVLWMATAIIVAYILYWFFERNTSKLKTYLKGIIK